MRRVNLTELKNRLSHYLRLVKRGETVEVLERHVPVARLTGVEPVARDHGALLQRLIKDGLVTAPKGRPYVELLDKPPLPCKGDAVRALIEERGDR